jgi:hypothetical protein
LPKTVEATVAVRTEAGRRSHFQCPNCGRRISYKVAYPLSFPMGKTCPGCRWHWSVVGADGIGPKADDIVGQTNNIRVAALEGSIDEREPVVLSDVVEELVERRVGRPEVGPMVNVRMPEELIAWIDDQVEQRGTTRAAFVRDMLAEAQQKASDR